MSKSLSLVFLMFMSSLAIAKTHGSNVSAKTEIKFDPAVYSLPSIDEAKAINLIKASEAKRKPSNSMIIDENSLSPKMRTDIEKRLFALTTSEEVDAFIDDLNKNYDTLPNDAKMYVALLTPIKSYRGIFYKIRPVFEHKANFAHTQVLTMVKSMAARFNIFFPSTYAGAFFQYISTPYVGKDGNVVASFNNENDIKYFLSSEVLTSLKTVVTRLEALNLEEGVTWDARLFNGKNSFQDNIGRFHFVGEFEKNLMLSSYYGAISSIAVTNAYNTDNSIELYKLSFISHHL